MFLFSLFLALFIWTIHNLSLKYSTYLQYSISVRTNIEGRVMEAISEDAIILRARASGYNLLLHKFNDVVNVDIEPKFFHQISPASDTFVVRVSEIKSQLEKTLLEDLQSVESYSTEQVRFILHKVESKKVPVIAQSEVTYMPQFIPTSDIKLSPDSVLIYGEESDIGRVEAVYTKIISHSKVYEGIQGFIDLIPIKDVTISLSQILYSQEVERYVEQTIELPIEVINSPADKDVLVLTSKVKLIYRQPLASHKPYSSADFRCVVDYDDLKNSISFQVLPKLEKAPSRIYNPTFDPPYLECIVLDK